MVKISAFVIAMNALVGNQVSVVGLNPLQINGGSILMFNTTIVDFVKNPYFILNTFAQAEYFEEDFAEEFEFELLQGLEVIYNFYFL